MSMLNTTRDQPDVRGRPHPGTLTGRIWEIADEITRRERSACGAPRGHRPIRMLRMATGIRRHAVSVLEAAPPRTAECHSPRTFRRIARCGPAATEGLFGRPSPDPSRQARSDGPGRGWPGHGTRGSGRASYCFSGGSGSTDSGPHAEVQEAGGEHRRISSWRKDAPCRETHEHRLRQLGAARDRLPGRWRRGCGATA